MATREVTEGPERALVRNREVHVVDLKSSCACCRQGVTRVPAEENDALFNCEPPYKVLFFADGSERSKLDVERERDKIRSKFNEGASRAAQNANNLQLMALAENVIFEYSFQKDISQLARAVDEIKPVILHLACHGSKEGVMTIGGKTITPHELARSLCGMAESNTRLRLVVLNLCWSGVVAMELSQHVDFVIGHDASVEDKNAIAFSKSLYYWLGRNITLLSNVACMSRPSCRTFHPLARVPSEVRTWRGTERHSSSTDLSNREEAISPCQSPAGCM
ncbi:hypothetical protein GUITHDRAFT_155486, partial [Guillardia theta CCMP2712]